MSWEPDPSELNPPSEPYARGNPSPRAPRRPTAAEIQDWLVAKLAQELEIDPRDIDAREPFSTYGLSSVLAVSLSGDLEDWLGRPLSPTLAFDYPSIEALAGHLSGESDPTTRQDVASTGFRADKEAVALVGIGCRFPGANGPRAFWELLSEGRDAITEVPPDRWDAESLYDPNPDTPGKMNSKWGGFLQGVDQFDARFFGISPREAARMDPQQRLLLEVGWEALEDAGIVPKELSGTATGVFMGVSTNDYLRLLLTTDEGAHDDPYSGTGAAAGIASGRLSYALGLQGPTLTVDTACSSSLVAVHLAIRSLLSRECDTALAGGVNLILVPESTVYFSKVRAMSPEGRCKAFDASADGYVRSEGCGVLVLKRLADALAQGDRVYAVLSGSAVNHDGRSGGLTVPNGQAQQRVIRAALADAGVDPLDVGYVEAHGTGTSLGDPIEVRALASVLCENRHPSAALAIGSVKTNIGHLEAPSGVAGLIKVALALQHREIPPHLHLRRRNPHVEWDQLPISIPTERTPWKPVHGKRIAGVSSFGFSGANAHVVVAEAPEPPPAVHDPAAQAEAFFLPLSARSETALQKIAEQFHDILSQSEIQLRDICHTCAARREHHDHRLAVFGKTREDLTARLKSFLAGESERQGVRSGKVPTNHTPRLGFHFPDVGPSWSEFTTSLRHSSREFDAVVSLAKSEAGRYANVAPISRRHVDPPVEGFPNPETAFCAYQIALANHLRAHGVIVETFHGEGLGQIAADCLAGKLTLQEAIRVAACGERPHIEPGRSATRETDWARSRCDLFVRIGPRQDSQEAPPRGKGGRSRPLELDFSSDLPKAVPADLLATLYCAGFPIHWNSLWPHGGRHVDLPTYPWDHERHWIEPSGDGWSARSRDPRFGRAVELAGSPGSFVWEAGLDGRLLERMGLNGRARIKDLSPSMVERVAETAALETLKRDLRVTNLRLTGEAISPPSAADPVLQVALSSVEGGAGFRLYSRSTNGHPGAGIWALLAEGNLCEEAGADGTSHQWFHEVVWEHKPIQGGAGLDRGRVSLVFSDDSGVSSAFLRQLGTANLIRVRRGETFQRPSEMEFEISPSDPSHFGRLLAEVHASGASPVRDIVFLWGLDLPGSGGVNAPTFEKSLAERLAEALHLIQACIRAGTKQAPRLRFVTRGAVHTGVAEDEAVEPAQAALMGLTRALAGEHPALWGGHIDLDPSMSPERTAAILAREIDCLDGEDRVALRGSERLVARLIPCSLGEETSDSVVPLGNRVCLITGGMGEIGRELARWFARRGARRIVLLGRTPAPARVEWNAIPEGHPRRELVESLMEIESHGAEVRCVAADVGDMASMQHALEELAREGWDSFGGVVHAAGVADPKPLLELDRDTLAKTLHPKVSGALILADLLKNHPLEFFVLFSSGAAVLNSPLLGAYSAANCFLDALPQSLGQTGIRATSIAWGFWSEVGLAARYRREGGRGLLPRGMEPIEPSEGLRIFGGILRERPKQVVVMPIDWRAWGDFHRRVGGSAPLLEKVLAGARAERGGDAQEGRERSGALERLMGAPSEQRRALLEDILADQVAAILGFSPARMDRAQPLDNLGIDSLMAVELKNWAESELGILVPVSLFLEGPSLTDLVTRLLPDVLATISSRSGNPPRHPSARPNEETRDIITPERAEKLLSELDGLSDEEVERLLGSLASQQES
ncbi:MAG: hypothetical protein GHCLOJNM_02625 [bacterium]|nr:hypothetical protein [bacterium]